MKRKLETNFNLVEVRKAINIYKANLINWLSKPIASDFLKQLMFTIQSSLYDDQIEKFAPEEIYELLSSFQKWR